MYLHSFSFVRETEIPAMAAGHCAVELVSFNVEQPWRGCRVITTPRPASSPSPDQALVRVLCRPLNPADLLCLQGLYIGWIPSILPCTPGFEGMGLVAKVFLLCKIPKETSS
jgi:D-arabinose 1-dehydrogenase-like Zn-dependent alcohol dehydrogenase